MKQQSASLPPRPEPQDYASYILDVLKPFDDAVNTVSKRLIEVTATLNQIGCPSEGPGAHAFISFMMKAKLYLSITDRVVETSGEIVPLCISSYINHQISTYGTGLSASNPVALPSQVGKHALETLLRYFHNHTEDETIPDEERYRQDEELLFGMNAIRVIELLSASSALGIPPLVDICKGALERIKASGSGSVPPLPPLEKVYPRLPAVEDEADDQQPSDSRSHHPSSRTATRTAFATASLTGLLNMGGNNSAEHRTRLQSLLQARKKQEEGVEKKSSGAGPNNHQKDVGDKNKQEDTRSLDELLSFLGVSEGESLAKKAHPKPPAPNKKKHKSADKGKGQARGKDRPWDTTGTDSDTGSEKEVDVRKQAAPPSHPLPSETSEAVLKEEDVSAGPSFTHSELGRDSISSSPEVSPASIEESQPASIFKEMVPLFSSKSHLPMSHSVIGSIALQPIIPSRPLPFAGAGKARARLSALPQLEGEDEDEDA